MDWSPLLPPSDEQGENLLLMMGMTHLLEDPRFQTGFHRLANADAFDAEVKPWFLERSSQEIVELCQEWRVPAAYVNNVAHILDDPQYQARAFWQPMDHPEAGPLPYPAAPFKMSKHPPSCSEPLYWGNTIWKFMVTAWACPGKRWIR